MGKSVLALDVGTNSLHCMLADLEGRPLSEASAPIEYFTPDGCPSLAREFDPRAVLDGLGRLVGEVLTGSGNGAEDLCAIGVTGQRQGEVFLDGDGREIYCGPNIDLRAVFEGASMDEYLGGEIYATTGHRPSLLLAPARLRWFRQHRPSVFEAIRSVLTVPGWLAYRLTGNRVSEASLEAEAGLLDVATGERPWALLDRLGVPGSFLPDVSPGPLTAGVLTGSAAAPWELPGGVPVVVAGPDTQCGLLGMGLARPGQTGAVLGWSGALQVLTPAPRHDEAGRTWLGRYPVQELWTAESSLGDAGNAYRWLKDTLLGPDASFEEADRLAVENATDHGSVAALLGPAPVSPWQAGLRMGGLLFPTPLSFQDTSRGQLLRAALEGMAFSLKAHLGILREVSGGDTGVLHLGGGMSRSRTLAGILANVLGALVKRSAVPHVSAMGTAVAVASTLDSLSLDQMVEAATVDFEEVEPGSATEIARYREQYEQWLELYHRLGHD